MIKSRTILKTVVMCAAMFGVAQATTINMTPIAPSSNQGNAVWQDIKGVSYSWLDLNSNSFVDVGEKVTFTVDMEKYYWGTHNYDALKVWIDNTPINPPSSTIYTQNFIWDYNQGISDYTNESKYSHKLWKGGDKFFSFDYTFSQVGTYDLTASVMCSRDLSGLTYAHGSNRWNDNPTTNDWNAWTENVHKTTKGTNGYNLQGETERYQLRVVKTNVPEPGSFSLMLLGLSSLFGAAFMRKKRK
jgi:hypothetical protein